MNKNALPPSLVANLQQVLISRKSSEEEQQTSETMEAPASAPSAETSPEVGSEETSSKPVILVTNADGIESAGLICLVESLVRDGQFDVHVCAPQIDKSASGHSLTVSKTVEVSSAEISGATAYGVADILLLFLCILLLLLISQAESPMAITQALSGILDDEDN